MKRSSTTTISEGSDDDMQDDDQSLSEVKSAIEQIFVAFQEPLESYDVTLFSLQDEIQDAMDYARRYLSLQCTSYRKVWYNLHICPDAGMWPNVLILCHLAFSLPFSNGRAEQIFSSLKIVKRNNRTSLLKSTLDDLLEIFVEGPALRDFSSDHAVELWWNDCCTTRRTNQSQRKAYRRREKDVDHDETEPEGLDTANILDTWDDLFDEGVMTKFNEVNCTICHIIF